MRLSIALKEQKPQNELKLFLMSDAVIAGLAGQIPKEGYNLKQMLEILTAQNVEVKLCKTCTDARGISGLALFHYLQIMSR
ncbi:DsrE family protein [Xenorhabdus sp. Sc-CR9]|uniref:DsrE family protein n=1 Tax=Xenorhabdus sp. Sc-CR9 TaxID=2584468 RepID=UPI001F363B5A